MTENLEVTCPIFLFSSSNAFVTYDLFLQYGSFYMQDNQ